MTERLFGLADSAARLAELYEGARRPGALILHGPAQIGKRALVERLASALLEGAPLEGGAFIDREIGALVRQRAHPDLVWIERQKNDKGQLRTQITVEQIHKLLAATQQTPSIAALKVVVIDEAERMNQNAANALLKRLEEPTGTVLFFLITSARDRLLPTIRSRSMALSIPPLTRAEFDRWQRAAGLQARGSELFDLAEGAPGRAAALVQGNLLELLRRLPSPDQRLSAGDARKIAAPIAALGGEERAVVRTHYVAQLRRDCRENAAQNPQNLTARLARYDAARTLLRNADRLNLDEQSVWIRLLCG